MDISKTYSRQNKNIFNFIYSFYFIRIRKKLYHDYQIEDLWPFCFKHFSRSSRLFSSKSIMPFRCERVKKTYLYMIKPLQRREHATRSERPVSNFYEYESVQSAINHGRQHSGGFQHPSGHPSFPPSRAEFSPVRSSGRRPQSRIYLPNEGFCFCFLFKYCRCLQYEYKPS